MASVQAHRVKYLDAFRGIAILLMIPLHLFLFGGGLSGVWGGGGSGSATVYPLPIALSRPLSTGIILFFFVCGFALVESLLKREGKQSLLQMEKHVVIRYGLYMLIGVAAELLLTLYSRGITDIAYQLQRIFGTASLSLSQPIIGLALAAMIAFPIMRYLSWKKLLVLALVWAVAEGLIIYAVDFPKELIYRLLFVNSFAVMKGIPMVLFGGAVGKALHEGKEMGRKTFYAALAVVLAYVVVPFFLNTGGYHLILVLWAYPYAMTFVAAASIFALGIFIRLERRGTKLSALTVLGRSSFAVYYGHYVILYFGLGLLSYLGVETTLPIVLTEMVIATIAIWVIIYFVSKRKWGDPSTW
jgi:peptidoglycan/LPS O-acetylase OafA/YrhL